MPKPTQTEADYKRVFGRLRRWAQYSGPKEYQGILLPTNRAVERALATAVGMWDFKRPLPKRMRQDEKGGIVFEMEDGVSEYQFKVDGSWWELQKASDNYSGRCVQICGALP